MRTNRDAWNWDSARLRCLREARRHTRSEADAQDVVQEAMLQAWRFRQACHDQDNPLPWMLAITRREAWRRGRPKVQELGLDEHMTGERANFDDKIGLPERLDLRAAIAGLSRSDRELLRLRYVEDLPQPAVAVRLGIPEGTAKVRLHRLRNRLRDTLITS